MLLLVTLLAVPLEGPFGRVEIDLARPSLTSLTLRRPDGRLEPRSLLSPPGHAWQRGMVTWGEGAYTNVVDDRGRRFESRRRPPEAVERAAGGWILRGVTLADETGDQVAREDWRLDVHGGELRWLVTRTWLRQLSVSCSGAPALYFSCRPVSTSPSAVLPNAVATTVWIDPAELRGRHDPRYRPEQWSFGYKLALENEVVSAPSDGWAILKLFAAWPHRAEPRLAVRGHLYRRGHFGWLSEAGVVAQPVPREIALGAVERTELRIAAVPAEASGHQLAVWADDPTSTVAALRRFYGALFNGGCVNDALRYTFGNETDGWYYAGASWMKGLPMLAGAPAPEPCAARPLELPRAFRDNLAQIAGTEYQPGLTRFGYNASGAFTDDNLNQVLGGRAYYLYSGDLAFVRWMLPFYRRAVDWYLARRNAAGLVSLEPVAHWYYDAMSASGVTTYHNAFCYRALVDLAGLENAAGNGAEAARRAGQAAALKDAINRVLWWDEAPGGPRYVDWILPDGTKIAYAADLCQFPPVAFGIASSEQGRRLLTTLDRRIGELERERGYLGLASRSAYWPVPALVNGHPANQRFGEYMNGGSFLAMTYWEVMARAAVGDAEGAWERLRRFADGTRLTGEFGFIGNNWVQETGRIGLWAADEPYLSDAIAVPAALVQGILGIRHTNDGLEVRPVLPASLPAAAAEVVHLGLRYRVTVGRGGTTIEPLGRAFTPPRALTWRVDAGCPPAAELHVGRTFEAGDHWRATPAIQVRRGAGLVLRRPLAGPLVGLWKLNDPPGDAALDDSAAGAHAARHGDVRFGQPDRHGRPAAASFSAGAQLVAGELEPYLFGPDQSFTLQAWFRTASAENQVILARPGAFSLGVKAGRLSAWIMQAGGQFVEAAGSAPAADGAWHHAAAVIDRATQTLALFLDGRPDGGPNSIAAIGASDSRVPLSVGAFAGGFPFDGTIDEVAVHRTALAPEALAVAHDLSPAPRPTPEALSGAYTTAPCDWGQRARFTGLRLGCEPAQGTIEVTVETSDDGFASVSARHRPDAAGRLRLPPARWARVIIVLGMPSGAERGPIVSALELSAEPER